MAGSIFGKIFQISTWGESHGKGIGVVIDGCPAGLELDEGDIQVFLDRRKPGQSAYTTHRKESDLATIYSGTFEGKTTGTPISILIPNEDQHSKDYGNIAKIYRPGHADFTFDQKYGFRDYRGGGRSSGRETAARVAAGAVASKILSKMGIFLSAYTKSIGPVSIPSSEYHLEERMDNSLFMPNNAYAKEAEAFLSDCIQKRDSAGGVIECVVKGLPCGIGNPVFDKLDALLAEAMFSIGAVKGFEVGDGLDVSTSYGSENNDPFYVKDGKIKASSNHCGGVLGGMSNVSDLIFRVAIKPTPSIGQMQHSATSDFEETDFEIKGRHDPVIVPRAVVVVESMAAITLVDLLFSNMSSRMDKIIDFYQKN